MKIFISYADDDVGTARKIYEDLKREGFAPWLNESDLLPGQNWKIAIRKAIKSSDYVVALISKRSVGKRGFVHKQQKIAMDILDEMPESEIFFIPVRVDDCELPDSLEHLLPTDIFPSYDTGFGKILAAIKRRGNWERQTVDMSPRAESDTPSHAEYQVQGSRVGVIGDNIHVEGGIHFHGDGSPEKRPEPSEAVPPAEPPPGRTAAPPETDDRKTPGWVLKVSVTSALVFIASLMAIALVVPDPTGFQVFVFRIVLALAAAAFGATIPGFLKLRQPLPAGGLLHAGGAVVLFVLIFLANPPELITRNAPPPEIIPQKLTGTILGQDGEPLTGVSVTLQETGRQTRTDSRGAFTFEIEAEKGKMVRIMAQKEGFKTRRMDVTAGTGGHTFKMEEKP